MSPRREMTWIVIRFHAAWLRFLLKVSVQTMRRVAHELAVLERENAGYRDGALFRLLREQIEFVIQDVGKTPWTVARSKRDLRGRKLRGRGLLPRFRGAPLELRDAMRKHLTARHG
ncbi:MAG: hypothetical protein FJX60_23805 [Alphaproteobacteria bacterium]|nr:hypothetical protein [Alphaproteobacteria bacterium]